MSDGNGLRLVLSGEDEYEPSPKQERIGKFSNFSVMLDLKPCVVFQANTHFPVPLPPNRSLPCLALSSLQCECPLPAPYFLLSWLLVCSSEKKSRQAGTFGRCFRLSHIRTYIVFTIY